MVKNLPAMQETWVQSLGREDPMEKGMTTHSTHLVWRVPWTEEPGKLQSKEWQESNVTAHTHTHTEHIAVPNQTLYNITHLSITYISML